MINTFLNRFDNLTIREKIILLATVMITIWGGWDNLFYQPIAAEQKSLHTERSNLKAILLANQQATAQIESLGKTDPNKANKQKLTRLKQNLKQLKQQLNTGDKQFVPAHLMTQVLQDMLNKNYGLKLQNLETLPIITLTNTKQQKSWVFHHGLSITLTGNYFNTLNYLKSLESLPWRFNWESINYQVTEYPKAETTIHIYTLSFEENWLGL